MKLGRKTLSIVLSLMMVFGTIVIGGNGLSKFLDVFSIKASAGGGDYQFSGTENGLDYAIYHYEDDAYGYAIIIDYIESVDGSIVIPDYIGGYPVKEIITSFRNDVKSIKLPDTLDYIDSYTFENSACRNDLNNWENGAFYVDGYIVETSDDISGNFTARPGTRGVGVDAFSKRTNLTSVTFYDGLKHIYSRAFQGCTSLTTINIPDSVTQIDSAAFEDTAYYNNESNWVNGVLYLGSNLIRCKQDYEGTCIIENGTKCIAGGAFAPYTGWEDIGGGIRRHYSHPLDKLNDVVLPRSLLTIGDAAFASTIITSVVIPDNVLKIGEYAFSNCVSLESIKIGLNTKEIGISAFANCNSVNSIIVNASNLFYYVSNKCLIKKSTETIIKGFFTDTIPAVKSISAEAFIDSTITTAIIPDSITKIGDSAFECSENLTRVTLPNNLRLLGEFAFYRCYKLKEISIPGTVKKIQGWAFTDCGSLGSVNFGDGVEIIERYAFDRCISLESIRFPSTISVIESEAFNECCNLKEVTITNKLTTIEFAAFRLGCDYNVSWYEKRYQAAVEAGEETITDGFPIEFVKRIIDSPSEKLDDVYFLGTAEEWAAIKPSVDDENDDLLTATFHFLGGLGNSKSSKGISNYTSVREEAYKTTITFNSGYDSIPSGTVVHWFIDGKDRGTGKKYTVEKATDDYTVQTKLIDNESNVLAESEIETVKIKSSFFAKLIAFFRQLFNKLPVIEQ